jgi:hypothetical protein
MKIVILPSARDDLADGYQFYENQEAGLGNYFLESLFLTLIRCLCMPEFIGKLSAITTRSRSGFLT